jgi:hypothetical protein
MNALQRMLLLAQLAGTLALLASDAPNLVKAVIFPCWWLLTFSLRISKAELLFYGAICSVFTVMDILTVQQGIFSFTQPDLAGLPLYEPLMWGFYVLHTLRMLNPPSLRFSPLSLLLLIPFATAFSCISDPTWLLITTAAILAAGLCAFHQSADIACVLYMMLLGAAVEYTGVTGGQWRYAEAPAGGVPLWFLTLWGGVGLFVRRIGLPLREAIHTMIQGRDAPEQLHIEARS